MVDVAVVDVVVVVVVVVCVLRLRTGQRWWRRGRQRLRGGGQRWRGRGRQAGALRFGVVEAELPIAPPSVAPAASATTTSWALT